MPLLLGLSGPAGVTPAALVQTMQGSLPAEASSRLLEWLPARNPARTDAPRDPSPPRFSFFNPSALPPAQPPRLLPPLTWVQTHREAGLFSGPAEDSQRFALLPQWSYLKVVDSAPGWLLVRYEGDGARQPGQAWVPAGAVGPVGTPRWLVNLRETPLYAGPERAAPPYTQLPPWSVLEATGQAEGDRALVRYSGDGETRQAGAAWVSLVDLDVAQAPPGSRIPWGAAPGSAADVARLAVPYRTQLDGSRYAGTNCGPSAVGMALEAFGLFVPTGDLRDLANRLQGTWDPDGGVLIEVLEAVVRRYELRGLGLERPDGSFRRWTLDDVRRHLRAGHPVIPQLRYRLLPGREGFPISYDHYVVLTGFDGDTFYYNDPIPNGGRGRDLPISAAALEHAWGASDLPFGAFAVTR